MTEEPDNMGQDRRKYDRLDLKPRATIRSAHGEHEVNGQVIDLSASGALIKLDADAEWIQADKKVVVVLGWSQAAVSWMRYESLVGVVIRRIKEDQVAIEFDDHMIKV